MWSPRSRRIPRLCHRRRSRSARSHRQRLVVRRSSGQGGACGRRMDRRRYPPLTSSLVTVIEWPGEVRRPISHVRWCEHAQIGFATVTCVVTHRGGRLQSPTGPPAADRPKHLPRRRVIRLSRADASGLGMLSLVVIDRLQPADDHRHQALSAPLPTVHQ